MINFKIRKIYLKFHLPQLLLQHRVSKHIKKGKNWFSATDYKQSVKNENGSFSLIPLK